MPAGYEYTLSGHIRQDMRGRPQLVKPGEIAVVVWYKHDEYPYWPCLVKQVTEDRSKCALRLLNLGKLETQGVTISMDCLEKCAKDFFCDEREHLVDAGCRSSIKAFEISLRKAKYLTKDRQVNTRLAEFFRESGFSLDRGDAAGVVSENSVEIAEQKRSFSEPPELVMSVESDDIATKPAAGVRTRKRERAASKIVASEVAEVPPTKSKGVVSANSHLEAERESSLSKSQDLMKSVEFDSTANVPEASEANVRTRKRTPAASKIVTDKCSKKPPCSPKEIETIEMGPSRVVAEVQVQFEVQAEVHATFDCDPRERHSPARLLPRNHEKSLRDFLEWQRQLSMEMDLHDDLLVIDDGSPVVFRADMLVWFKPKEQPFWPAVIENEVKNNFYVRLISYESGESEFVVPKKEAAKVLKPYPGNDYLVLTAVAQIFMNPSPFRVAVKAANKYLQERQRGRKTIDLCEHLRQLKLIAVKPGGESQDGDVEMI